jgi:hypothetical protein
LAQEKIHVSIRFKTTVERAALRLEKNAVKDECVIPILRDVSHRERQAKLVQCQLDRAFRLRELLGQLIVAL